MRLRRIRLCAAALCALALVNVSGCARNARPAPAPAEPAVTPADAPPSHRTGQRFSPGAPQPGWTRYEQRRTIAPGQTVTAGPAPYARVKLIEVAENRKSALFEAEHLTDRRRGRVSVGETFHVFTPIFGNKGARLEAASAAGATVVFRWSQSAATAVAPGAVALPAAGANEGDMRSR